MQPGENGTTPREETAPDAVWAQAHQLIRRLETSSVRRVAVEVGGVKVEVERAVPVMPAPGADGAAPDPGVPAGLYATAFGPGPGVAPEARSASGMFAALDAGAAPDLRLPVLAPLVGTLYRASGPGAKPFVEVGDTVEPGQTLCTVEAMKLFNEVVALEAGKVAELAVADGERVEYEQVLMYLDPLEA